MRVLDRLQRTPRLGFAIAVLLYGKGLPGSGHAPIVGLVAWSATGSGITSAAANTLTDRDLSHSLNRGADFGEKSWCVSAVAPEPGSYRFLWHSGGLHAFFLVTAFQESFTAEILVDAGPEALMLLVFGLLGLRLFRTVPGHITDRL